MVKGLFGTDLEKEFIRLQQHEIDLERSQFHENTPHLPLDGKLIEIEEIGDAKPYFFYESHESRVKDNGWERALSIREMNMLMIYNAKFKLKGKYARIAQHIQNGEQEYLCTAMQRVENKLHLLDYVTGIRIEPFADAYFIPAEKDWYSGFMPFDINGLNSGWNGIQKVNEINESLIYYLFGMDYVMIPDDFKMDNNCMIYIPGDESGIWPIVYGKNEKYSFGGLNDQGASRGVRVVDE